MAHRTSAAALHTARLILKEYSLTVRPPETLVSGSIHNLENTEAHVAIIIDYASNVFHIAGLRPEIHYWQKHLSAGDASAPQIAAFVSKILTTWDLIPQYAPDEAPVIASFAAPREFGKIKPQVTKLSKAALEVPRLIFHYYAVAPYGRVPDEKVDRHSIARFAEAGLGLTKFAKYIPVLKQEQDRLRRGILSEADVRRCLRTVGILLEYLPNYENREEETKLLV